MYAQITHSLVTVSMHWHFPSGLQEMQGFPAILLACLLLHRRCPGILILLIREERCISGRSKAQMRQNPTME